MHQSKQGIKNNNGIYLSIDLDYWCDKKDPNKSAYNFLKEIAKLNKEIVVVNSHERLVEHINDSKCNTLINVDYHSDLADGFYKNKYLVKTKIGEEVPFQEGTWGNFIKWQKHGTFVWVYPSFSKCVKFEAGLCHFGDEDPFVKKCTNWNNTKRYAFCKNILKDNIYSKIKAIGICTSACWLHPTQLEADFLPQLVGAFSKKEAKEIVFKRFTNYVRLKF